MRNFAPHDDQKKGSKKLPPPSAITPALIAVIQSMPFYRFFYSSPIRL